MTDITPVEKTWDIDRGIEEVASTLKSEIALLQERPGSSTDERRFQGDFGSGLRSRLIGELWVPRRWLPKTVEVTIQKIGDDATRIRVVVKDRHKFGVKWGLTKRYGQALQELAESIEHSIQQSLSV